MLSEKSLEHVPNVKPLILQGITVSLIIHSERFRALRHRRKIKRFQTGSLAPAKPDKASVFKEEKKAPLKADKLDVTHTETRNKFSIICTKDAQGVVSVSQKLFRIFSTPLR